MSSGNNVNAQATPPSAALVKTEDTAPVERRPTGGPFVLWPSNVAEGIQLAAMASKARLYGVTSPEDAFIRMATGMELGLSPWQAMRSIYVIENRPSMAADLMVALCHRASDICEKFQCVETTATHAKYVAKRKGMPEQTLTWTMEQAQRAGLLGKNNWKSHPEAMLRARCSAALARLAFPELMLGLYTPDELDEARERGGKVVTVTAEGQVVDVPLEERGGAPPTGGAPPPPPGATQRNFADEVAVLIKRVEEVSKIGDTATREDRKRALRADLEASDIPKPLITGAIAAYNDTFGRKKQEPAK